MLSKDEKSKIIDDLAYCFSVFSEENQKKLSTLDKLVIKPFNVYTDVKIIGMKKWIAKELDTYYLFVWRLILEKYNEEIKCKEEELLIRGIKGKFKCLCKKDNEHNGVHEVVSFKMKLDDENENKGRFTLEIWSKWLKRKHLIHTCEEREFEILTWEFSEKELNI